MSELRFCITGGSGFLGTNLCALLSRRDLEWLNIDVVEPKCPAYKGNWIKQDVRELKGLKQAIDDFCPTHIVHLAARTDLLGMYINDYDTNIIGVNNVIEVAQCLPKLRRVIYASSMLATQPHSLPEILPPTTKYGLSKLIGEELVQRSGERYSWVIIRPTSVWGPWFSEPYLQFFKLIRARLYFHIGRKKVCKPYGYVENTVEQILRIALNHRNDLDFKTLYLHDEVPNSVHEWANAIRSELGLTHFVVVPYFVAKALAYLGDFLSMFGLRFPMTSFRLHNMTHSIELPANQSILSFPSLASPAKSMQEGITKTCKWIDQYDKDC